MFLLVCHKQLHHGTKALSKGANMKTRLSYATLAFTSVVLVAILPCEVQPQGANPITGFCAFLFQLRDEKGKKIEVNGEEVYVMDRRGEKGLWIPGNTPWN